MNGSEMKGRPTVLERVKQKMLTFEALEKLTLESVSHFYLKLLWRSLCLCRFWCPPMGKDVQFIPRYHLLLSVHAVEM